MNEAETQKKLYSWAFGLGLATVFFNILEGLFSTWLGYRDETIALFGFGVDSFIEVLSALGILQMISRIQKNPDSPRAPFEKTALQITGTGFYLLAIGLVASAIISIVQGSRPESTFWGIVISLVSISLMLFLVMAKRSVGKKLHSEPILADANCTMACIYMSMVLLASSFAFQLTGIGYIDAIGAVGIAIFAFNEGGESFEKAAGKECCCGDKKSA